MPRSLTTFTYNVSHENQSLQKLQRLSQPDLGLLESEGIGWDYGIRNITGILLQQIQFGTDIITLQEGADLYIERIFGARPKRGPAVLGVLQTLQTAVVPKLPHPKNWSEEATTRRAGLLEVLEKGFMNPFHAAELGLDVCTLEQQLSKYGYHQGKHIAQIYNRDTLEILDEPSLLQPDPRTTCKFQNGRPYMVTTFKMKHIYQSNDRSKNANLLLINAHGPHKPGFSTDCFSKFFSYDEMSKFFKGPDGRGTRIDFIIMQGDLNRPVESYARGSKDCIQVEIGKGKNVGLMKLEPKPDSRSRHAPAHLGTYVSFKHGYKRFAKLSTDAAKATSLVRCRVLPATRSAAFDNVLFAASDYKNNPVFSGNEARILPTRGPASDHAPLMARFNVARGGADTNYYYALETYGALPYDYMKTRVDKAKSLRKTWEAKGHGKGTAKAGGTSGKGQRRSSRSKVDDWTLEKGEEGDDVEDCVEGEDALEELDPDAHEDQSEYIAELEQLIKFLLLLLASYPDASDEK